MLKKTEEIVEKIEASKEVLLAMPKNNAKNIKIYKTKIEDLENEYSKYQKDILKKLKKVYKSNIKKDNSIEIEQLTTLINRNTNMLEILDDGKTSYEKMGLDKSIFTIARYYKDNLENINEQIQVCIEKFEQVGIQLSLDDFQYSIYVKNYMKIFLQELKKGKMNSDVLKEKFEEIYWKCPDIILHIELNIRSIYLKKQKEIDKFFEKEKKQKMKKMKLTQEKIFQNNVELKKQLTNKKATDVGIIQSKFLSGELDVKNFTNDKIDIELKKILPADFVENLNENDEIKNNITKFLNSLYEYENYLKFKFIIDDIKVYYKEKDKYKKTYLETKKEIEKLEKSLRKINKKTFVKLPFLIKRIDANSSSDIKDLIQKIKDKYKELEMNKFYYKIYSKLDANATVYEALKLASSYYLYLTSCIIKNNKNIQLAEIETMISELNEFLDSPFNAIINYLSLSEENDLLIIIKDRYKLLNFTIEKEDLSSNNIGTLISVLENIQMFLNMKKANVKLEDIEQLCQIKKILQLN